MERELIERVRRICVKGGVKETVMGEICLAVREEFAASADVQGGWIPVRELLPTMEVDRKHWMESKRAVVFVQRPGENYEAFGWLTTKHGGGYEWRIQGHNGDWDQYVTHWMPLPNPPSNSPRSDK